MKIPVIVSATAGAGVVNVLEVKKTDDGYAIVADNRWRELGAVKVTHKIIDGLQVRTWEGTAVRRTGTRAKTHQGKTKRELIENMLRSAGYEEVSDTATIPSLF